ncbi:MAG: Si-specific NAD(P)(+) transhydrogenase [Planctomycetes bacterium]|nr:Si-specific NAD(P)(+) transhydrogenase [Planctomycetota bacterium]
MPSPNTHYELVVIGAGPAGHKAAIHAANAGHRVLLVDRDPTPGGECVHRGTIPSKTLRESALYLAGLKQRAAGIATAEIGAQTKVESLMQRLKHVQKAHEQFMRGQIERPGVEFARGRARFRSAHELELAQPGGTRHCVSADHFVIATGSRPRLPAEMQIDHERILDSDSILSLIYLPESLTVLGAGVIASEFATIFQALGVRVTMIDKSPRPLGFLDPEITERFVSAFTALGGTWVPGLKPVSCSFDGIASTVTKLEDGSLIRSEKTLVALGRTASVSSLDLAAAGLATNERGYIPVDANMRTAVEHIYAAGDVVGPPALAASAMEQGRHAARHMFGLDVTSSMETIPAGIYTIPEMSSIGLSEADAIKRHGSALVGRAHFSELARGQISGDTEGMLKLVAEPATGKVLGAQIIGEGATELIHLAQLAMVGEMSVDTFVDHVFNFPTLAEAYRVAALECITQRAQLRLAS